MNNKKKQQYIFWSVFIILVIILGVWLFMSGSATKLPDDSGGVIAQNGSQNREMVKEAMIGFFGKTIEDSDKLTNLKIFGNYARADFQFSDTQAGSVFAVKKDLVWTLAFTTAKDFILLCSTANSYGFPSQIVDQCVNFDGTVKAR